MSFTIDSVLLFPSKLRQCTSFQSQPQLYDSFMDLVKQYSSSEIDTQDLLRRLTVMLAGHPAILKEFNELLPSGMTLDSCIEFLSTSGSELLPKIEKSWDMEDEPEPSQSASNFIMASEHDRESVLREHQKHRLAEISKYGTYKELAFFEKVRQLMGNDETYLNFLRCLTLYTRDILNGSELIEVLQPFTLKDSQLASDLRSMLGCSVPDRVSIASTQAIHSKSSEAVMDIDYATCKKHGISYRALPSSFPQPVCTGRSLPGNEVCNEVLNDIWVSFPLWSEDSTFGNSKISQYEEFMYRCEDERFELDIVIDSMASTVQLLEDAGVKLSRLSLDEAKAFQLDACIGGFSEVHPRKSIERIYGDKVGDVMESLMHRPSVAVPIVLRRLKTRIVEFREAKKNYIKLWKEECDKNYAKWLQSQTSTFRQLDARQMRPKTLLNEAEVAAEETFGNRFCCRVRHQEFVLTNKSDLRDATNLIIHYLNYLPTVQTDDSFRISQLLHDTLPQLISMPTPRNTGGASSHNEDSGEQYSVMFTNSGWYIFLRHFHMFCKRLEEIRLQCERMQLESQVCDLTMHNGMKTRSYYDFMLNLVRMMIEGAIDNFVFENDMQKVLGPNAFITFSVEKILHNIVKQLHHLVCDELSKQLIEMFHEECSRGVASGSVSTAYRRQLAEFAYRNRALRLINDDYCFRIVFFKVTGRITMELVDPDAHTAPDELLANHCRTAEYVDRYLDCEENSSDQFIDLIRTPTFLSRNVKQSEASSQRALLHSVDKTRCLIGSGCYKITFMSGSWSVLYREKALSVARKKFRSQMLFKRQKFYEWWSAWKSENVSADQERRARDWLTRPPGAHHKTTRSAKSRFRVKRLVKTIQE